MFLFKSALTISPSPVIGRRKNEQGEIKMDTNNQNQQQTPMQATEAYPLEDRSLRADEVITAQQTESTEDAFAPTFIP
jgi:hypothetical protein